MIQQETWKPVVGFEGLYEVSNMGNVRSLGNHAGTVYKPLHVLKFEVRYGYNMVRLYKGDSRSAKLVHRLVAEAFIPNTENKPNVNHKNSLRHDNAVSNLEWCTHKENMDHYVESRKLNIQKPKYEYPYQKKAKAA